MLEKHEGRIQHAINPIQAHSHSICRSSEQDPHRTIIEGIQDVQELHDPDKVSLTWVKHLYGLVDKLNDTETQMTGMKPKDVIKLNQMPLIKQENYPLENTLPEGGLYRYLLQPDEKHDNQRKRAMDRIWSKKTYRLSEIVENSGNRVMYYLKDGPERAFVKEELMLIPEDTELPPDYVQKW